MCNKKSQIENEKGIAVLLGLFMLFAVTIAGLLLLYLSQRDKMASIDSSKIRNIAFAADASLKACESQFNHNPDTIAAILNKYNIDNSYKWILSSTSIGAKTENKFALGNGGMKYSAYISAYNPDNQIIQVKGIGFGSTFEQKNVTGIYKLYGLKKITSSGNKTNYVLYLAGNGRNFDARYDVQGDVYCGTDFHMNAGASNSEFRGIFKTGKNSTMESGMDGSGIVFDSLTYIGTGLSVNGLNTFKSITGIEGKLTINSTLTLKNEGWFNGYNDGPQRINMNNHTIHHSGQINMSRVDNAIEDNKHVPITDIVDKIGVGSTVDDPWTVDTTGLFAKAKTIVGGYYASDFTSLYNSTPNSEKVNGYLVLTDTWGSVEIRESAQVFSGKVILLLKYGLNVNGHFFNMDANSRMLIIGYNWASLSGFGGADGNQFTGLIYLMNNAGITMQWSGTNTYNGAIHLASKTCTWQANSGTLLKLVYNESVLSEFESIGILKRPMGGGGEATDSIVLTDSKIRPQLVGVAY